MSKEARSEHRVRRMLRAAGYSNPQKVIDAIRNDIPNVRLPKEDDKDTYKFLEGVARMYIKGELNNANTIMEVNNTLLLVASDAHKKEYNANLNGLTSQNLIDRFKIARRENRITDEQKSRAIRRTRNTDYDIIKVDSAEIAAQYKAYTSWCITTSEHMFDSYTKNGLGLFYFLLKKDFDKIHRPDNYSDNPLDEYGKSMIAVSVTMDGSLNTCTCRYNHDCGGNDSVMNREAIEELLGMSFYDACPGRSKEELRALGVSEWLGKLVGHRKTGAVGFCVSVYPDGRPHHLMSTSWIEDPDNGELLMTWERAKQITDSMPGWELPSKEIIDKVVRHKEVINQRIQYYIDQQEAGVDVESLIEWVD